MDGRVDLARTLAEIRAMAAFDVICLQEVAVNFPGLAGSAGEDEVAILSAGLPGYSAVYGPAVDLPDGHDGRKQFGNLILSRLPVGQVWRHLLPWPADAAVPSMQRVLVEAVVTAEFGPVRVLTTHLEYYSRLQREAQIDAVRRLHAEACAHARQPRPGEDEAGGSFEVFDRPVSAVFCGDMNYPAEAAERARMLAPYGDGTVAWRDCWSVLHGEAPHAPTVGIHQVDWVERPSCFDFVYLTEDLASRLRGHHVNAVTAASDHQPVWVELG
jgi:endonuclease/exonuclease/phosphatase family metal-dependent hydrolase